MYFSLAREIFGASLAEAIIEEAQKKEVTIFEVENFNVIPGLGVEGNINNEYYFIGNQKLMSEHSVDLTTFETQAESLANQGKTVMFAANSKGILGLIAVADVLKPSSKEAIRQLHDLGMEVTMLTGDNKKTARAIQEQIGDIKVIAEVLPQDKDREVTRLQAEGKQVAMVGDGINDAPALVRSDLGIAIGSGTDIAIESADIVLMRDDLLDAVTAFRLSKSVMKNIKQNLFWAFFYNIIGIPLAAGVFYPLLGWKLSPMFAALAMSFSSVTVVLNALRLTKFKPTQKQ